MVIKRGHVARRKSTLLLISDSQTQSSAALSIPYTYLINVTISPFEKARTGVYQRWWVLQGMESSHLYPTVNKLERMMRLLKIFESENDYLLHREEIEKTCNYYFKRTLYLK